MKVSGKILPGSVRVSVMAEGQRPRKTKRKREKATPVNAEIQAAVEKERHAQSIARAKRNMQDEQFAHQTFMSELCNHKHFFSNQFRPCHRIDFKAPYSTFQCQMTKEFTRSKNDVTQPSRHHAMHRIPMQGILD